ncbi:MAG: sulfotransferase domain-containing protein [Phycisphaerales bacterium]|nr:sulfotransferase domain-containing protein [Phycisphaerales bacterium]
MGTRRRETSHWYQGKPFRAIQRAFCGVTFNYPHRNLFIVGLPKSGTSWLNRMVCKTPGYQKWTPHYITWTDHALKPETLQHPPAGYTVTKLHCKPTPAHLQLFNSVKRPYVIIHRDLRDVAASWYFFAHNVSTDAHADPIKSMEKEEALDYWTENRLPDYVSWVNGWADGRDPQYGLMIRYEELVADTLGMMRRVFDHYEVGLSDEKVRQIVHKHAFKTATGREAGQEDQHSFNRKGVVGDWVNHFTPELKEKFKKIAGETLQRFGYVADDDW